MSYIQPNQQFEFDVFLAHNSEDKKDFIIPIKEKLEAYNLKPWIDYEEIPPGYFFQDEIQKAISKVKTAAIFIGKNGLGNWQSLEIRTFINQCLKNGKPVIPVLLPGVSQIPEEWYFLQELHWVRFDNIDDQKALNNLYWGITGRKIDDSSDEGGTAPETQPVIKEILKIIGGLEQLVFRKNDNDIVSKLSDIAVNSFDFDTKTVILRTPLAALHSASFSYSIQYGGMRKAEFFTEQPNFIDMIFIEGGHFYMGSPEDEPEPQKIDHLEGPLHLVTVKPFFMSKFPITQAQWKAIAGLPKEAIDLDPSPLNRFDDKERNFESDYKPIVKVSWHEANEFCRRLSKQTEKQSKQTGKQYKLPSEAQWEYACRAGTTTPFYFGKTILPELANYNGNSTYLFGNKGQYRECTTLCIPGDYPPNSFGLYDMHGNVWEWCEDDWHSDYSGGVPTDGSARVLAPTSATSKARRVLRGGSWDSRANACRSASRINCPPDQKDYTIGFRIVWNLF